MPIHITLPRLGWSMEEGIFLEWLKKSGDYVKDGEPLFTLESDKAAQEVESTDSGILHIPSSGPAPGAKVKVGAVLGYLLASGELPPDEQTSSPPLPSSPAPVPHHLPLGEGAAADTGSLKHKLQSDTPASPRARRAAKATGVDLAALQPTGKGGRIRECDVLAASLELGGTGMKWRTTPTSPLRRTIAERMEHSKRNTVPVTITTRCDATGMVSLRTQLKAAAEFRVPSFIDIITKLAAGALKSHPHLSGRWADGAIQLPEAIHIGVAVDTELGLVVPVLRDVAGLALSEVSQKSQELFERARRGGLKATEMRDACFTITNLGGLGVEAFTPVINYPETAILGVGAIVREAVSLEDGTLVSRQQLTLSLTFDHRAIDGAPAARFLQTLRQRIEHPLVWLLNER